MKIKTKVYLAAMLVAISCSCASAATVAPTKPPVLSHQQILTHLLIAEMAYQREQYNLALDNYLLVATSTHNAEVAQLATELALQLQDISKAATAAQIWAESANNDVQAQLIAVTLLINSNNSKAMAFLNKAFDLQQSDIDQQLLLILSKLSTSGQKNLTNAVFKVAKQRPQNANVQLAAAQVAAVQFNIAEAEKHVDLALKLKPGLTNAIELKAKLIRHKLDKDEPALNYLEQQVNKYPRNDELRMFYISALTDANLNSKAIPHLKLLSKSTEYAGDALITLGEIEVNNNNLEAAENYIKRALKYPNSVDKARYYLAQFAEYRNKFPEAIALYESVDESSEFHTTAYLRAAFLYSSNGELNKALNTLQEASPSTLAEHKEVLLSETDILIDLKDYDQALDNCNRVISVLPNDIDFLYARSVIYDLQKNTPDAEKDLRTILSLDPNNANALNALGFILSNQPAKLNEAMPLLEKALNLNPDNPAFMDSMGWLLFKMGKNEEAISMLTKAYQLSNDAEIAAHLGEVLWATGKLDDAKKVFSKALSVADDHQVIEDTMDRLKIPNSGLPQKAPGR